MENISYIIEKSNSDYFGVRKLPYAVFLSLLKHFRLRDLQSTSEGRELLAKSKRLYATEPELDKLNQLKNQLNRSKITKE
ncbi:hypothetical protein A7D23_11290 [Dehalobacter sp. TeCB1]|jgi:hypothetical protein|nr:hypothetical protein A7D23_11290 [Dehalobacter sp. TeCB1]